MERYIGLDAHAASCTLAVISDAGRRLKDFPVETNGQALVEAIRMIPGRKHLVFEEGLRARGSTRRCSLMWTRWWSRELRGVVKLIT